MTVTDADREKARHMITSSGTWVGEEGTWQDNLIACVAYGLAAERETARAQAWDEGWAARRIFSETCEPAPVNPYRAVTPRG